MLEHVWEEISMDFVEGLPVSYGKTTIWVIVNRLSKFAHFKPLKHPFSAAQLAKIFFKVIVKLYGIPISITSDRDRIFTSDFWSELFKLQGTKLQLSSTYYPQTDGQTERVNQYLKVYLRCFCNTKPVEWSNWLH